jgi:glycine/D-amino acid oxidase-like deaminating enzyme
MDLKSDSMFWPTLASAPPSCRPLRQNVRCDVAIVGAGLTGAFTGCSLSKAGLDVVLVDKRAIGKGSTSASTALVLYEIDTSLVQLIRIRGEAAAVRSYQCCLEAITILERLVGGWSNDCGFHRRPSLYLASHKSDVGDLKKEFKARRKAGFPVKYLSAGAIETMFSFRAPGAILSADAAEINPLQLTFQLVGTARKQGARVFAPTEITRVTEHRRGVKIRTSSGHDIAARWVVMAGGFETNSPVARRVVKLKSTYALVTKPLRRFPRWYERCLVWETHRPYFYLRGTEDDRIMIGGGDEDFYDPKARDRLIPEKSRLLQKKLRQLFPETTILPAYSWAGTFGETKDGLPYIGPARKNSQILYALCYGANGTNFAVLAADIIRDLVLKQRNTDAGLFAFER